ncbi:MAG: hypothetical protein KDB79_16970, partial [Acidobacteria bacterium]|nr:hypothetical protein [Acidobacteriota bacterium]
QLDINVELARYLYTLPSRISTRLRWLGETEKANNSPIKAKAYFDQALIYSGDYLAFFDRYVSTNSGARINKRSQSMAFLEHSQNLTKVGDLKNASEYLERAENLVTALQKNDKNNEESTLDELLILSVRQEILTQQEKTDAALKIVKRAVKIADAHHRKDPMNADAMGFLSFFSSRAALILQMQGRDGEAKSYRSLVQEYEANYREQFGRDLKYNF